MLFLCALLVADGELAKTSTNNVTTKPAIAEAPECILLSLAVWEPTSWFFASRWHAGDLLPTVSSLG